MPFRSEYAYHWDSAEFAIAIRDYNVALGQPHAPGYFLYIMAGRLMTLLVGDPHTGLVWLSVFCGSALVSVLYLLGTAMFGRRTGIVTALLAMTSPQLWFHSDVALTYIADSFLVCWVVLFCWRARQRGGTWLDTVLIGGLLAVAGGVRQQSVIALVPLLAWFFWGFQRPRLLKLAVAAGVSVALATMWFVPMVLMSGGLGAYLEIVRRHAAFNAAATWWGGGFDRFTWNLFFVGVFCANGLMLGAFALAGSLFYRAWGMDASRRQAWNQQHGLRCKQSRFGSSAWRFWPLPWVSRSSRGMY